MKAINKDPLLTSGSKPLLVTYSFNSIEFAALPRQGIPPNVDVARPKTILTGIEKNLKN